MKKFFLKIKILYNERMNRINEDKNNYHIRLERQA